MRKNVKYMILGLSILLITLSISIPILVIGQTNTSKNSDQDLIYDTGVIIYLNFEGGFFGIKSDDGKNYDPINLPPEFAIDGLKVLFIGEKLDLASFHMWGIIIRIIFIQKI
ncbi:MAG: hypothetical protein ACFE9C_10460 [Candidatus Hodarchaeota archaeon]